MDHSEGGQGVICVMLECVSIVILFNLSSCVSAVLSDGDGSQDHLLPVCMDKACTKSAIYLEKPGQPEVHHSPSSVHHVPCSSSIASPFFPVLTAFAPNNPVNSQ